MHGLSSLAVLLAFAPAPTASEQLEVTAQCRGPELDSFVSFGSAHAPRLLKIYIDAVEPNQLQIWLEARRIVGERGDELRLELIPTRGGLSRRDPEPDSVRLWFAAAAALGYTEEALRLLERQDWQRVAAQIRTLEGRKALAREFGIEPETFEARRRGPAGACLERRFERVSDDLAAHTSGQRALVVGVVGRDGREQISYVDAQLTELRTQLDRIDPSNAGPTALGVSIHANEFIHGREAPRTGANIRLDRTFPATGVLVGGEALSHHLVIFVEDEEHGRLADWLAPAMRYREQNPGVLSVQVIAGGIGGRAVSLRRRLCAARTLGLEVEYLLYLAQRPAIRRLHEADLNDVLEPVADSDACSDAEPLEPEPASSDIGTGPDPDTRRASSFGHPRGAWLDGRPASPADLEGLEWRLASTLEQNIIDWLTTPEIIAGESFEFGF